MYTSGYEGFFHLDHIDGTTEFAVGDYIIRDHNREKFEQNNMIISGLSPNGVLVEAVEIPDKKFFVGVQYHPEFKSRPNHAHPVFREFVRAAIK